MKPLPKVAIAILNWNGKNFLQQFLPSVLSSTYSNYETVVIDNNSEDDSVSFLTVNYPAVRIIRHTQNWGFARGYNEALKQVTSDYYVILNSDVEVTNGWLQPMVELLESDSTIAVCQPKILAYSNKKMFEYAGAAGGWIDKYGYPFSKGRVFDICENDTG
ncbi:MAG TPA: glycosyltransferase, partial [Chitinophagaceae bacterium]|nr:glycosyltransferase [Chitinophagaceae bacterium]